MDVNVKDHPYDAVGNGVTDDTDAFNLAITAVNGSGGGQVFVPHGTYWINGGGITTLIGDDTHLVGEDKHNTTLLLGEDPATVLGEDSTAIFLKGHGNGWSIEHLHFNMGDYNSPPPLIGDPPPQHSDYTPHSRTTCISGTGDNWLIQDCAITRMGRMGIVATGLPGSTCSNFEINGCTIQKTIRSPYANQSILTTDSGSDNSPLNGRILNNHCSNSGIFLFGFDCEISGNMVTGAGYGTGIGTGISQNAARWTISNNVCSGGRGIDENNTWITGFEIHSPDTLIEGNTASDNAGSGITIACPRCTIKSNECFDNGVETARYGIAMQHNGPIENASHCLVTLNHCYDTRFPANTQTQTYGYVEEAGGLVDITVIGNDFSHNKLGQHIYNATGFHQDGGETRPEAPSGVNIVFRYRPDDYPEWLFWQEFIQKFDLIGRPGAIDGGGIPQARAGFAPRISLNKPKNACDPTTGRNLRRGFDFQVKLAGVGHVVIHRFRLHAQRIVERSLSR
jgi:parallel beta-helix repeat protein